MTSLPYPTYLNSPPSSYHDRSAVGKCRIFPAAVENSTVYSSVLSKCIEHTTASSTTPSNDDEKQAKKKLLKKLYKSSVGDLSTFVTSSSEPSSLNLDVSIIDVEVVLPVKDVIETDGLIATVFLDAGAARIVLDLDCQTNTLENGVASTFLGALELTRLPRSRIMAHFSNVAPSLDECHESVSSCISQSLSLVDSVSLSFEGASILDVSVEEVMKFYTFVKEKNTEGHATLVIQCATGSTEETEYEESTQKVSQISKQGKGNILVTLVDPSAKELGLCWAACCRTDRPDGLYTTVVCTRNNEALGLVYSSKESIVASLTGGRAVYYSRSRKGLWRKGDTSGHFQTLHRLDVDCDGDAIRFTVTQNGEDCKAFCHLNTLTCWGESRGFRHLEETLVDRVKNAPAGSYTKRLLDDEGLLRDKLVEEAQELSEANNKEEVAGELADVIYFAMVQAAKYGVSIDDAVSVLDTRARKVTRRQGDSKAFRIEAGKAILSKNKEGN